MPVYRLIDILRWFVHGLWQLRVNETILPTWLLLREPHDPPACWYYYYSRGLWDYYCADKRPSWTGAYMYYNSAKKAFRVWVDARTSEARELAVSIVRGFTGYVRYGFLTFQSWMEFLTGKIGWSGIPFAPNLSRAVEYLFNWLPSSITRYGQSWSNIWEGIKNAVKSWVRARYETARTWVNNSAPWVINWIITLRGWYNHVRATVNSIVNNPTGFIVGRLGATWQRLKRYSDNCLDFYWSIWSHYSSELSSFLSNPGNYIWDKLEDVWIRLW